jgi:hypothetical protein
MLLYSIVSYLMEILLALLLLPVKAIMISYCHT